VLDLDIPAEISDSPASDLGDDLDEEFQQDQLSDAPGSSSNPTEEDAREAWVSQSKKNRFRFENLDEVESFDTAKAAWIKQMDKKGSRHVSKDAARAAYIAKVFEPIVQAAEPVPVEKEKAAWIGKMTQEGKQFQSADEAKAAWIAQMDKKNKFGKQHDYNGRSQSGMTTMDESSASTMDEAKAAWISQMSKKGTSFTSPYEATNEYVSKVFEPVVASVPAVPLDQAKAAWIKQMSKKGKTYTSVDEAKAAWIAQIDAKKKKQWGPASGESSAPPQQAASAKTAETNAGRHVGPFGSTGTGKKWWR
jgi:hypothetical protein